jgi:hypothetical protein
VPKPARKRLVLSAAARAASVEKHVGALRSAIHRFFILRASAIAATAAELYARATKADESDAAKAKRIADELGIESWDELADTVKASLIVIYTEGGDAAIKALDMEGSSLFDVLNQEALDYAKARGAELVGMKWVDGELVINPRAEWAVTDATRDGLRDLIQKAFDEGMSPTELGDAIQDSYLFSSARSDLIAKTELATAHTQGELQAMKDSGVVSGKQLLPSDSHEEDDCDDYFDQTFELDDPDPDSPIHPGCNCTNVYVLAAEEEAAA